MTEWFLIFLWSRFSLCRKMWNNFKTDVLMHFSYILEFSLRVQIRICIKLVIQTIGELILRVVS